MKIRYGRYQELSSAETVLAVIAFLVLMVWWTPFVIATILQEMLRNRHRD